MLLKELPQGATVYALSYSIEGVKAFETKITAKASEPHYRNQQRTQQQSSTLMPQVSTEVVVDIYVDMDGKALPFEVNENSTIARGKSMLNGVDYIVAVEKDAIIRELKEIKAKFESYVQLAPKYEKNAKACDDILSTWDPVTAERKKSDERLSAMEERMQNMEGIMQKLYESLNGTK